jgi:hypothetical protein
MRELSIVDLNVVAGGEYSAGDMIATGTALGGGIGLSLAATFGLTASEGLTLAGLGSVAGAGLTAAGLAGWAAGNGLNNNTNIQSWIAGMLDKLNSTLDGDE